MTYNTLTTLSFKLNKDGDIEQNKDIVKDILTDVSYVYSYIVKSISEKEKIVILVKFTISENNRHNTIKSISMINKILEVLNKDVELNKVIAYEQPNLDIIFEIYNKFIMKIAKQQSNIWHLEYDDTYQICALSIVKLYNKKYYLNRYIVEKTCKNDILYSIRKNINKPIIESLDQVIKTDNTENIRYCDVVEDETCRKDFENTVENDATIKMFNEVKSILVNKFGERKFDKLYRDYTKGHTDSISVTTMQKVRIYLKSRNITYKSLQGEEYER